MIPQRTLSGICEITTGTFSITQRPPVFTGEASALKVEVAFTFQGVDYDIPSGVHAEMYLKFPNTDKMTVAVQMTTENNVATGVLSDEQTGTAGYPLLVVQLTDEETGNLIVACATSVKVSDVRGKYIVDYRAPNPSEIVYIGRSPYIDPVTGHWMQWNVTLNAYEDTNVVARGMPATFTAQATTLPAGSSATASISGTAENPVLNLGVPQGIQGVKGDTGNAAGFGTPTASVDANTGTPSVTVSASGPDTAKVFDFAFHNLKGQKGDTGGVSSVNGKSGIVQLNDEDIPSSVVSGQTTVEGALSSLSGQIEELETDLNNRGTVVKFPVFTTPITVNDPDSYTTIGRLTNVYLKKGTYVLIYNLSAKWTYALYQFWSYISIDNTRVECGSYATPTDGFVPCIGIIDVANDGNHEIVLSCRVGNASKSVTVNEFQEIRLSLIKVK